MELPSKKNRIGNESLDSNMWCMWRGTCPYGSCGGHVAHLGSTLSCRLSMSYLGSTMSCRLARCGLSVNASTSRGIGQLAIGDHEGAVPSSPSTTA